MNFFELVAAVEAYTGVAGEIDDAEMAVWFNEAQLDLALDFAPIKTAVVTANADGVAPVPPDNIRIIDSPSDFDWASDGQLVFRSGPGEHTIYYRAMPAPEHVFTGADPDQTPDLPYMLHYLLSIFAAARYWDRESEGDTEEMNLANKWLSAYYAAKKNMLSKLDQAGGKIDRWRVI